jgi:hypothetical protein
MEKLMELVIRPWCVWCLTGFGKGLLIVGIVTATMNKSFGGFTPILWFLLALACYLLAITVVTMLILARLNNTARS